MTTTINITIPENLSEITLEQYQEYVKLPEDIDEKLLMLNMVRIYTNVNDPTKLPLQDVKEIAVHLNNLLQQSNDLVQRFTLGTGKSTTEFGFIPDLENMSFGEYIDLESNFSDWEDFHRAMAILYRPVIKSSKGLYEIEEYVSSQKYATVMKHMPMNVVMGAMVFFFNIEKALVKNTQSFLKKEIQKMITDNNQTSQAGDSLIKSGTGILQSLNSLVTISPSSMPSLNSRFRNVSFS